MYENVAWFGGSFSPPTIMHVKVALDIGKALYDITSDKAKSCVCIVPVSGAYKKGSVRDSCIPQADRWELAEAFLAAVQHESTLGEKIDFRLLDHEFLSPKAMSTFESLSYLKPLGNTIFIAQGQDNIFAIVERTWNRSADLLRDYHFFMFPRGETSNAKTIKKNILSALTKENPRQKNIPFSEDDAEKILKKIYFLGTGFQDDISSSKVRKSIQMNDIDQLSSLIHPIVLAVLQEKMVHNPFLYKDSSCETVPVAGGRKRKTQRRKTTRGKK